MMISPSSVPLEPQVEVRHAGSTKVVVAHREFRIERQLGRQRVLWKDYLHILMISRVKPLARRSLRRPTLHPWAEILHIQDHLIELRFHVFRLLRRAA